MDVDGAALGARGGLPNSGVQVLLGHPLPGASRQVGQYVELLSCQLQQATIQLGLPRSEPDLQSAHRQHVTGVGLASAE